MRSNTENGVVFGVYVRLYSIGALATHAKMRRRRGGEKRGGRRRRSVGLGEGGYGQR